MKATLLRVTFVLAIVMAFTAVSASAQGIIKRQSFVVPFEFSVGEKLFPAGEYTVMSEAQLVRIQSKDGKRLANALPVRTVGVGSRTDVRLTFKRTGDQYQLAQIWLADGIGRELKRKRNSRSDVAQNSATVEITSVNR